MGSVFETLCEILVANVFGDESHIFISKFGKKSHFYSKTYRGGWGVGSTSLGNIPKKKHFFYCFPEGTHHWLCCTSGMHGAIKRGKSVQTFQNVIYHTPGPWSHCEKDCLVVGWRLNKTVVGGEKQFWEIIGLLNSDPGRGKKLQVNTFGKEVKFLRFNENILEQLFL